MPENYFAAAPDAEDVKLKLLSMKFWPTDDNDAARALREAAINIAAALSECERVTGFKPFLSTSSSATARYYNGTDYDGILDLRNGLLSLTSVTLDGQARTLSGSGKNVWLRPTNALADGEPYTQLKFPDYIPEIEERIVVTGRWGYCTELPPIVWQILVERAALKTILTVANPRDIAGIVQDGFSVQFDPVGAADPKFIIGKYDEMKFAPSLLPFTRVIG